MGNSYVELRVDDIDEAAQHNDKIKSIPRVAEVILHKILQIQSFICFILFKIYFFFYLNKPWTGKRQISKQTRERKRL